MHVVVKVCLLIPTPHVWAYCDCQLDLVTFCSLFANTSHPLHPAIISPILKDSRDSSLPAIKSNYWHKLNLLSPALLIHSKPVLHHKKYDHRAQLQIPILTLKSPLIRPFYPCIAFPISHGFCLLRYPQCST